MLNSGPNAKVTHQTTILRQAQDSIAFGKKKFFLTFNNKILPVIGNLLFFRY
jgi:hypothetical protein